MVYGANGYSGSLLARLAADRGERPVLAGRSAAVAGLAGELGLPHRAFPLSAPDLDGVTAVVNCAGPFADTARPLVDACLAAGVHYLDITGELDVFDWMFAQSSRAVTAGVVLLTGAGFDVVPTDCLAAMLVAAMPGATTLELAFDAPGGLSRGTARTSSARRRPVAAAASAGPWSRRRSARRRGPCPSRRGSGPWARPGGATS
ncbi:saccharopine dehydrogenase family protein [Dactylosporangium cerinum]